MGEWARRHHKISEAYISDISTLKKEGMFESLKPSLFISEKTRIKGTVHPQSTRNQIDCKLIYLLVVPKSLLCLWRKEGEKVFHRTRDFKEV